MLLRKKEKKMLLVEFDWGCGKSLVLKFVGLFSFESFEVFLTFQKGRLFVLFPLIFQQVFQRSVFFPAFLFFFLFFFQLFCFFFVFFFVFFLFFCFFLFFGLLLLSKGPYHPQTTCFLVFSL